MKCPTCSHSETKVIDSRLNGDGGSIRRRRECEKCEYRFTTYEYVEQVPLMVVKKDGRRQAFDRTRVVSGLMKACEKRPVSIERIEEITVEIERTIQKKFDREIDSKVIGELVMEKLSQLDEVAYVRFASVYRQFRDVNQFMQELKSILDKEKPASPAAARVVPNLPIRRYSGAAKAQPATGALEAREDRFKQKDDPKQQDRRK